MVQVDNHDDGKREVTEADYQETSKGKAANSFTVLLQIYFPLYPLQTLLLKQFKETSHHLCRVSFEKEAKRQDLY